MLTFSQFWYSALGFSRLSKRLIEPFNSLSFAESNKLGNERFGVRWRCGGGISSTDRSTQSISSRKSTPCSSVNQPCLLLKSWIENPADCRSRGKWLTTSQWNNRVSISPVEYWWRHCVQMSEMVDACLVLVRYERNSDDAPLRLFTQQN